MSTVYGQGFLPWLEPVALERGQEIEVDLHADPVGGDYIWRWDTRIAAHSGQPERIFRQSTFEGAQFMSETLRRRAADYVPLLTEAGLAERWLLQAMDGIASLEEIAQGATEQFPEVFRRQEDAFRRVSALAERFSRQQSRYNGEFRAASAELPGDCLTESLSQGAEVVEAEWALLLECARPQLNRQRLAEKLRTPLDWSSLIAFAEDHGTLGLTAGRLVSYNEDVIPLENREALRTWRRNQTLFTMNLSAEMFRLFDCFAASSIEALVIKGPVLSVRSHGDPGLRQYGDLDLIVRDKDILRCTELMIGLGYDPSVSVAAIHAKKIPGEYNFRQPSTRLLIEFHTELTFRYHPRPLPLEDLFRRHVREKLDAREVPALSPEDELILICIHGAKHFWERLIYIADVAAFVSRQELDWARVKSAAEEVGAERMLRVGLRLAADVLGAPLPEETAAAARSDPAIGRLARQIIRWLPAAGSAPPGIFERAKFRLGMHGGIFSGLAYLLRLSFSPTEEDWIEGEENKRHWFLDALGRPFRLARKYGRDGKS